MSDPIALTKPVLAVLEKCYGAEIDRRLPAQFGKGPHHTINGIPVSEAVARAHTCGLIDQVDRKLGGGFVLVRGFALTDRGRAAYCEWAAGRDKPEDADA